MKLLCLLLACAAVALLPAIADAADKKRPMTLDDLFKLKRVGDPQVSPDGKWVVYVLTTVVDVGSNKTQANLWLVPTGGGESRQLTTTDKKDRHPRWSPDGKQILFESTRSGDGQLWVIDLAGGEARQLTKISTEAGTGIWSRDGKKIAFVSAVYPEFSEKPFKESDELNKKRIEEISKNPVKAKVFKRLFYRHWDSYVEDKRQHLFVMNADGTDIRDVTPGDRDANPTSSTFSVGDDFTFSPDGSHLVFTAVPEKGEAWSTDHDICRVSVTNTSTKWESLTRNNPSFNNAGADASPQFSPDGTKLAFRSQKRAGYEADQWRVLAFDSDPRGLTKGPPRPIDEQTPNSVNEFVWHPDGKSILYSTDWNGWVAVFAAGKETSGGQLPTGVNTGLSAAPGMLVFQKARLTGPAEVWASPSFNNDQAVQLTHHNDALYKELDRPEPESVSIPVEGGATMQMWILKPPGFDSAKKWPVAYLVHGGPQGAWEDGWSFRWCPQLWAAQGYVVALPNPRGSTGFGQKFVDEISGDWGGKCYRDLMAGVDYLERQRYVDKDRIGSAGASFGGYMQNWFAVNTGRFKCLITHCSVWNFESMWGTSDELWFDEWEHQGLPWEKPGKYREFSPHVQAGNLGKYKTPMLVIHNDLDFRCPIGQGHELFTALQRNGVKSKFVNFPDEGHWVLKPANGKFWHEQVFGWLKEHVPPGGK